MIFEIKIYFTNSIFPAFSTMLPIVIIKPFVFLHNFAPIAKRDIQTIGVLLLFIETLAKKQGH